ncbi:MAG: cob(I)yrinic acid a,c-diamide adenosyltransferase [Bacteroidota bacterium]
MKIYTRKGDEGATSLIGGSRVPKHDLRIETYGTVDELNSWIGLLRDQQIDVWYLDHLLRIQDRLFTIGSLLADDGTSKNIILPHLKENDITLLEDAIDRMEEQLPPMRNFVLPGGHPIVSYCHIARCVCRRAERHTVYLHEQHDVDPLILKYLNRLSDYLFVLSRSLGKELNAAESPWIPEKS